MHNFEEKSITEITKRTTVELNECSVANIKAAKNFLAKKLNNNPEDISDKIVINYALGLLPEHFAKLEADNADKK